MNTLRTVATKPARQCNFFYSFLKEPMNSFSFFTVVRSFSVAQPRLTGKTVEATTSSWDSLVTKSDHPVIVDFYAE